MSGGIFDLDVSGNTTEFVQTWLGPSLGWAMLPVQPILEVNTTSPITLTGFTNRVLIYGGPPASITVGQWVTSQGSNGLVQTISGFTREVMVKDYAGLAGVGNPITILPAGSDEIDGLSQYQIITLFQLVRFYPLTDLSGWYVG